MAAQAEQMRGPEVRHLRSHFTNEATHPTGSALLRFTWLESSELVFEPSLTDCYTSPTLPKLFLLYHNYPLAIIKILPKGKRLFGH